MNDRMKIVAGDSNPALAKEIADYLDMDLAEVELIRFKDGELSVKICENVRGVDLFIIQSTSNPANDHLMQLLLLIDAAMRASARRITAIIPYYGYARQDRKVEPRVPISAKVVANLLQAVGVNRVVTMELHSDQIQGFFDIPVDNLFASPKVIEYLNEINIDQPVVVSPDTGGVVRARFLASRIQAGLAIIDKRRPKPNVSEVMNVIGEVKGKNCILVDDMIDTAGSITQAAKALKANGAKDIYCVSTHAVLSGPAVERLQSADFREIIITNTIMVPEENRLPNMKILSTANLFGEALRRIHEGESVSSLFL
ncbi:MAG TPA: ribose-phosphate pyrophosphokinase [Spirochaetota bacterium]|nr:ribose-phosphate pyrophosphokinase [Spirochaetota bacterium]HPJ37118.1 ribose-phosphate pyrophosphokinase [Spirochaetota bacterium]HPQ53836.1 ribose-phosphate pyrophosphokinase [Spirochaetota bacterium]